MRISGTATLSQSRLLRGGPTVYRTSDFDPATSMSAPSSAASSPKNNGSGRTSPCRNKSCKSGLATLRQSLSGPVNYATDAQFLQFAGSSLAIAHNRRIVFLAICSDSPGMDLNSAICDLRFDLTTDCRSYPVAMHVPISPHVSQKAALFRGWQRLPYLRSDRTKRVNNRAPVSSSVSDNLCSFPHEPDQLSSRARELGAPFRR